MGSVFTAMPNTALWVPTRRSPANKRCPTQTPAACRRPAVRRSGTAHSAPPLPHKSQLRVLPCCCHTAATLHVCCFVLAVVNDGNDKALCAMSSYPGGQPIPTRAHCERQHAALTLLRGCRTLLFRPSGSWVSWSHLQRRASSSTLTYQPASTKSRSYRAATRSLSVKAATA